MREPPLKFLIAAEKIKSSKKIVQYKKMIFAFLQLSLTVLLSDN